MSHKFETKKRDTITGREYCVCTKCKQVMVSGDIFFNTYCVADANEIRDIKQRVAPTAELPETDLISTDSPTHSVHLSREEYEAKIRATERAKVYSEVEDLVRKKVLPAPKYSDYEANTLHKRFTAIINQLKEEGK